MIDTDNPNPRDLVAEMTEVAREAARESVTDMVSARCTHICGLREKGKLDLDQFLAALTEVKEARDRVLLTIFPDWWDGTFTDGREP